MPAFDAKPRDLSLEEPPQVLAITKLCHGLPVTPIKFRWVSESQDALDAGPRGIGFPRSTGVPAAQ